MIGFWCKISIKLIWVAKYGKMGENHHFWSFPKTCTGTEQSGTGTVWVLVDFDQPYRYRSELYQYTLLYFDQCSYFSHNLLISYPI